MYCGYSKSIIINRKPSTIYIKNKGSFYFESNLSIVAAASLGVAIKNMTRTNLDAIFIMTDRTFKGGLTVDDTKKLVLPEVREFEFIGFENLQ